MTTLEKLISHFEKFPGIGARQAKRFAYHLLTEDRHTVSELAKLIENIQSSIIECHDCHRFFTTSGNEQLCRICSNSSRDSSKLMVTEHDSDIQAIERSSTYKGLYFVLGGTVPLLNSDDAKKVRGAALKHLVETRVAGGLNELILAFSVNPDGENTGRYVETLLKDIITEHNITVTTLGRGLSTGSELEYADPETIKNALENRKHT